jgi:predicted metal-binding membrane protein
MMIAMMLPSAAPMILTFASVNRSRREQQRAFVPVSAFVSGYLIIWIAFSLAATLLQWALHSAALLSPMMSMTSPRVAGALLMAAGIFQFTPWKTACLTRCANPLTLLLTGWREGTRGAIQMGMHHGLFCLGCCWALMLLLFVLGVMNITHHMDRCADNLRADRKTARPQRMVRKSYGCCLVCVGNCPVGPRLTESQLARALHAREALHIHVEVRAQLVACSCAPMCDGDGATSLGVSANYSSGCRELRKKSH